LLNRMNKSLKIICLLGKNYHKEDGNKFEKNQKTNWIA
jgi:hypothetical protein